MGLAEDLKALQELRDKGEVESETYERSRDALLAKLSPTVPPAEPEKWRIETNDRYSKIVAALISLSTASLVLPVLFLREFLGIPKEKALAPYLNGWAYLGWGSLGLSILLGLAYSWFSVKWVKLAWHQKIILSEDTLEIIMDVSFVFMLLFFLAGLVSSVWFFAVFHVKT